MKILAVLLMVIVAQIPSCNIDSGSDTIVGYVEDKYLAPVRDGGPLQPFILIGATEYQVPRPFWMEVRVGDLVKYENGQWTIVRRVPR
jgi:hypothetical protein